MSKVGIRVALTQKAETLAFELGLFERMTQIWNFLDSHLTLLSQATAGAIAALGVFAFFLGWRQSVVADSEQRLNQSKVAAVASETEKVKEGISKLSQTGRTLRPLAIDRFSKEVERVRGGKVRILVSGKDVEAYQFAGQLIKMCENSGLSVFPEPLVDLSVEMPLDGVCCWVRSQERQPAHAGAVQYALGEIGIPVTNGIGVAQDDEELVIGVGPKG